MSKTCLFKVSEKNGALIGNKSFHFSSLTTGQAVSKDSQYQIPKFSSLGFESYVFNV